MVREFGYIVAYVTAAISGRGGCDIGYPVGSFFLSNYLRYRLRFIYIQLLQNAVHFIKVGLRCGLLVKLSFKAE